MAGGRAGLFAVMPAALPVLVRVLAPTLVLASVAVSLPFFRIALESFFLLILTFTLQLLKIQGVTLVVRGNI